MRRGVGERCDEWEVEGVIGVYVSSCSVSKADVEKERRKGLCFGAVGGEG